MEIPIKIRKDISLEPAARAISEKTKEAMAFPEVLPLGCGIKLRMLSFVIRDLVVLSQAH